MADYKISLGVELDTSDIQTQINAAEKNAKPIEIKIDAETKELTKSINDALKTLSSGTKNALKIDTSEIKKSLDDLSSIVDKIKHSLGTLDNGDMKSLVSSINQMAKALGTAENESDSLVKSLTALSKKDFSINIGLDMGKKNNNMLAYGRVARKQVIPELEAQIKELETLLGGKQAAMTKLMSQSSKVEFDVFTDFADFNSDSAIKKMEAMEKYVNSLKKLTAFDGVKLDGFNEVHKNATELINDITGVENAVDKAGDVPEKIKKFFGSGVDAEGLSTQLDSIVADLTEIKTALQGLSSGTSLDGLTQSFDKLSNSIEQLVKNCTTAKQAINDSVGSGGLGGSTDIANNSVKNLNNDLKQVTVTADNTSDAINSIKNAMSGMKFNSASIDAATKDLQEMKIVIKEITAKQGKNFDITVKGINEVGEAVNVIKRFNDETGNFDIISTKISKPFNEGAEAAKKFKSSIKEASKLVGDAFNIKLSGNYKDAVSDLENLTNTSTDAKAKLDILKTSYDSLKSAQQSYNDVMQDSNSSIQQKVEAADKLIEAHKKYQAALEGSNALVKEENDAEIFANKKAAALDKIRDYTNRNTIAAKKYNEEIKIAQQLFANATTDAQHKAAESYWTTLTKKIKAAGDEGQSFGEKFKKAFASISQYLSAAQLFNYGERALRSMFEQVKAIDTAMTEVKKVTDETDASYNQFLTNAASRAKKLGTTIDGLVTSTADFARLGYGFEDAQWLAEVANIYTVVGDEISGVEDATQSLISTMAAFKDEMGSLSDSDFALSIVDKFNEVKFDAS